MLPTYEVLSQSGSAEDCTRGMEAAIQSEQIDRLEYDMEGKEK